MYHCQTITEYKNWVGMIGILALWFCISEAEELARFVKADNLGFGRGYYLMASSILVGGLTTSNLFTMQMGFCLAFVLIYLFRI